MKKNPDSFLTDLFAKNPKSKKSFFLIAGPCVIESEKMCLEHAAILKSICASLKIGFVFKSSYDKANRTSVTSFRGPGIAEGLKILKAVRDQINVPVLSDIHLPQEAEAAKHSLDVIQIPALLCRQTDLLLAAAKTGKIVNIKKAQFMAPQDMKHPIKKILSQGNQQIILTERGTCFGYHNLVSDMRSIPIMKKFNFPVVFDATHSVQLPSAGDDKSTGQSEFIQTLSLASVASGCDGLFLEVHKTPQTAPCDGPNMLRINELEALLIKAKKIWETINA